MLWLVFVSAYYVLSYGIITAAGQSTVSSCAVSLAGSEEGLQKRIDEHDRRLETMSKNMRSAVETLDKKLQTFSSAIDNINEKLNAVLEKVNGNSQYKGPQGRCQNDSVALDCSDIEANGYRTSGVYRIYVDHEGKRYYANVTCDMTTTNGPWTVFQRRKDGSVDFYRDWNDYANGFGNPEGEFWLGNNFLHLLTSKRRYRLRIDLEDFEGGKRYAEYSTFNISSSADKYRLTVGNYSGNAGDSLSYHNDRRFNTKDNVDDGSSGNCAVSYRGAWWYHACHQANLNGLYLRGRYSQNGSLNGYEGVAWDRWHGQWYSLKTTEMKISPY